ncbi:MAG: hypothetical protein ABF291_13935, partial [Desulfobacterales bacterium]
MHIRFPVQARPAVAGRDYGIVCITISFRSYLSLDIVNWNLFEICLPAVLLAGCLYFGIWIILSGQEDLKHARWRIRASIRWRLATEKHPS